MIQRALKLLLFLVIGFPSLALAIPSCEDEMSTASLRYLGTLRAAVEKGDVTQSQLKWILEQPRPTVPQANGQRLENYSYNKSFRSAVPLITPAQWRLVIAEVSKLAAEREQGQSKVAEAITETSFIPALISDFKFPVDETAAGHFVSGKGEIFLSANNLRTNETVLYNYSTRERRVFPGANSSKYGHDFFETTTGEILFAYNMKTHIAVVNATTGEAAMTPIALPPVAKSYKPLIFEERGIPMVVILDTITLGLSGAQIVLKINIPAGTIVSEPATPYASNRVLRLPNGHLYAFGVHRDPKTMKSSVILRDLSLGKDHVHLTNIGPEFLGKHVRLASGLAADGTMQPSILLKSADRNEKWLSLNPTTGLLEEIPDSAEFLQDSLVDFLGTTYAAHITPRDGILKPVLRNLKTGEEIVPDVEFSGRINQQPTILQTRSGILYVDGEFSSDSAQVTMHLMFLDQKHNYSISSSSIEAERIFYSPRDGRVLMLDFDEDFRSHLYQIWGPEGVRR